MIKLPTSSFGTINKFLIDHPDTVLRYAVRRISEDPNQERVDLFSFEDSDHIACCYRPEFVLILNEALSFFVEQELYEDAVICRDLITKISVDTVIRES